MPTATQILNEMAARYAGCSSYRDIGEVLTVFTELGPDEHRRRSARPFKTLFIRPDRFRFEFRERTIGPEEEWDRTVIVAHGDVVQTHWANGPDRPERSLGRSLAGATGISGGSAHTVPCMLLREEVRGFHLTQLHDVTLDGQEVLDGVECYVLQGTHPSSRQARTLWVGCEHLLLMRMYESSTHTPAPRPVDASMFANFDTSNPADAAEVERMRAYMANRPPVRCDTTTTYSPVIDEVIDVAEFEKPL